MLRELAIENLVLIDDVRITFAPGLNILTGETGAGKSIIIDAISLLMGERADREAIRSGCEKGRVEGLFDIAGNDELAEFLGQCGIEVDEDEYLILSRELNISGKNICRVNGISVPLSLLKEIGQRLINLHSQAAHYSLLDTEQHGLFLDRFAGSTVERLKEQVRISYQHWKQLGEELSQWSVDPQTRQREMDLLAYQINEIDGAHLRVGEDDELEQQRAMYSNYHRIMDALSKVHVNLYMGSDRQPALIDVLGDLQKEFKELAHFSPVLDKINSSIDELIYSLEELVSLARRYVDEMEYDPQQMEEIENRLDFINNLKRKYGKTIKDILHYRDELFKKLEFYQNSQQRIQELEEDRTSAERELYNLCLELSKQRKMAAAQLEARIEAELKDIAMEDASFKVSIISPADMDSADYAENGFDDISFLITTNRGEPLKPLAKVASGGEMSRIMLALNAVLGHVDRVPTMIFDEIDTGISGKTAQKVAQKLAYISREHQLICVTHLAQIASMADTHYLIKKVSDGERTHTEVHLLKERERLIEIARLLGGIDLSAASMNYAQEMINSSADFKTNSAFS